MNIRAKLFLLIFGIIVLLAGASSVYFILQTPVKRIESERRVLDELGNAIRTIQVELNRLDASTFVVQRPRFDKATLILGEAFKHLRDVVYLRTRDAQLAEAIDIVERLQKLNEENLASVKDLYNVLYQDAETLFVFPDSISFRRFYAEDSVADRKPQARVVALYNLSRFESAASILNDSLESSYQVILEQGDVIDERIATIRLRAALTASVIIGFFILLISVIAIIAANSIARSIFVIADGVRGLKEGDLSVSFDLKTKDEVGVLSRGMNEFIQALDDSVLGIKDAATRNAQVRDRLLDATRATGASLEEMRGAVRAVEAQAQRLDDRIGETRRSVNSIAGGVGQLDQRISDQIAMVEESTASITQMLATIGNMARLAERDRSLADGLVATSDSGREVFQSTFVKIEAIRERVDKIEEMIQIIDTIAGQTNLLAMNAAIEAAHAGEAGKGFAVVSDEIRKLAEASAEGSREIASSVRAIIDSIASAKDGSEATNKAFGEIDERIREVSRSVSEISSSLGETDVGGRQILTAMTSLRELSASINAESRRVAENTRVIDASMGDLDEVGNSVRESMNSIAGRSDDIAETSSRTASLAEELTSVGSDLEERISHFKTTSEAEGGTAAMDGTAAMGDIGGDEPADMEAVEAIPIL